MNNKLCATKICFLLIRFTVVPEKFAFIISPNYIFQTKKSKGAFIVMKKDSVI